MSLWNGMFSREDRFLALLEASATEGREGTERIEKLFQDKAGAFPIEEILRWRERNTEVAEELEQRLCQGAKGPFDREDIEMLARSLARIPRGLNKFGTRYQLCASRLRGEDFGAQRRMVAEATHTICQMVAELKHPKLSTTKVHHDALQKIESDADKLFLECIAQLQQRRQDPLRSLMLRDLYELLETVIDRCRTTGNIVLRIVLKNT